MPLWSAFIFAFMGSIHCIGMCGPLLLALPRGNSPLWYNRLIYNGGRIISYGALGVLAGWLGESLTPVQRGLMIASGVFLLLFSLMPFIFSKLGSSSPITYITTTVTAAYKPLLKRGDTIGFATLGMLNGLLPCGFVYWSLTGALAQTTPLDGGLYMLAFGLGTLPLMYGASLLPRLFSLSLRSRLSKCLPIASFFLGLLFLARGLALEIPYISAKPDWDPQKDAQPTMHCSDTKGSTTK